jgi:hypothetical protein
MGTGSQARLAILKRDAETKLLGPLQRHGWRTSVDKEVEHGDYITMSAERGGHRRTFALLYSSATDNAVYKRLQAEVDLILVNGALWRIESYSRGITKRILSADEFHPVLVGWNRESSKGKFAPDADEETTTDEEEEVGGHRLLLSEAPIEAIWLRLRQLQSVRLAERLIADRASRADVQLEESALSAKAEGVAFALRNATDYFNAS